MLHNVKRSWNPLLLFGILLLSYPEPAFPQADLMLPVSHYTASETFQGTRTTGTIRILAVMVAFQEEDNRFTTGNGSFDLPFLHRDDIIIDPLPHNQDYFEAHLEFAKNYFHTVSDGRLDIRYEVLPDVIHLDRPMSAYAPTGETDEENYKLAELARDAWTNAGNLDLPDLSGYNQDRTMFVVFHAGSGRNIELMGTSLDKTPQDIPSVFLGTGSLQRLLDDPGFDGFDIGAPNIRVTNTALLPQTQSRPGEDITGEQYVLQLSINGLIAANIGSFIGLPDLFNTETGASAIGRFGLMDGASIFSYLGLFPPEPSAWEKIHLGWEQPFDIRLDTGEPIRLPAVSLKESRSIARHAISADEYFLVENRHRNPSNEPLEITVRTPDGHYRTHHIEPDDDRFDPFDVSEYPEELRGVVVNVSNFDWSLPGGPDIVEDDASGTRVARILNGGILIWHIDEAVIRRNIDDNRINANSDRRGVQLMEADGARDIGRPPGPEQNRFTNGHAFDFWWEGNDFTVITPTGDSLIVYENRFGPDTRPSNESNTGSSSYFEFYDFSDRSPVAHFYARSLGGTFAQPLNPSLPPLPEPIGFGPDASGYPPGPEIVRLPSDDTSLRSGNIRSRNASGYSAGSSGSHGSGQQWTDDDLILIPTARGFYTLPLSRSDETYELLEHPEPSSPLIRNGTLITGQIRTAGNTDRQDVVSWSYGNNEWTQNWILEDLPAGPGLVSHDSDGTLHLDHTSVLIDFDGTILAREDGTPFQRSGEVDGLTATLEADRLELSDGSFHYDLSPEERESHRKYTGNLRFSGESNPSFFLITDERITIADQRNSDPWQVYTILEETPISWPAFGDWSGDETLDIIVTNQGDNTVLGFNRDGGLLDFFPLQAPQGRRFVGSPLLADITGDDRSELIVASVDSLSMTIHAYDRNMNPIEDFPLFAGSIDENRPHNSRPPLVLPMLIADSHLFAITPAGEVRGWELPQLGDVAWGRIYGPQPGNKVGINAESLSRISPDFGILNERETYNWPNPADDHTHVRFETSEQARIDITIINPSGSIVFEKQTESSGRHPQEIRLNTSSWGNGIYFARIRANNGRNSETKMIKIVVTH